MSKEKMKRYLADRNLIDLDIAANVKQEKERVFVSDVLNDFNSKINGLKIMNFTYVTSLIVSLLFCGIVSYQLIQVKSSDESKKEIIELRKENGDLHKKYIFYKGVSERYLEHQERCVEMRYDIPESLNRRIQKFKVSIGSGEDK